MKERQEFNNVRPVEEISGRRYRFIYEAHGITRHNPDNINGLRVLFKELVNHDFLEIGKYDPSQYLSTNFEKIIRKLGIPVFFVDLASDFIDSNSEKLIRMPAKILPAIYTAMGVGLLIADHDRRSFLKKSIGALLGIKGSLPLINNAPVIKTVFDGSDPSRGNFGKFSVDLNEKINPEMYAVAYTFRNLLWAYKIKYVQDNLLGIKQDEVSGLICGADHVGVEKFLALTKEELLEKIKKTVSILKVVGFKIVGLSNLGYCGPTTDYKYKSYVIDEIKDLEDK